MAKNGQKVATGTWAMLVVIASLNLVHAQTAKPVPGPVPSGDADRGKAVYASRCAQCHGEDLQGTSFGDGTPALKREDFLANRDLNELFAQLRRAMPFNAPATLSDREYADVFAFLLKENGVNADGH
jgi:S-disulfanyl-L-cysteine oxidoreductase SoxD